MIRPLTRSLARPLVRPLTGGDGTLVLPGYLHPAFTTTRASTATVRDSSGQIVSVAANLPRFDHDAAGNPLGLLVEESRTNLLTYSEQFDNAAWTKDGVTVSADASTAPDGTETMDKIVPSSSNVQHKIVQTFDTVAGNYTKSVFAKQGEYTWARVEFGGTVFGTAQWVNVNLATGAVGNTGSSTVGYSVTQAANGSWRINVTGSSSGAGIAEFHVRPLPSDDTGAPPSFAGDGTSGIYIWGAQLEAGSSASSYAPTTDSAVTRSADQESRTYALPSEYSGLYRFMTGKGAGVIAQWDDGTANERVTLERNSSDEIHLTVVDGGVTVADLTLGTVADDTEATAAFRLAANDIAGVLDGGTVQTDAVATLPTTTTHRIGGGISSGYLNGHISLGREYESGLPNAQLQSMTA